MKPDEIVAACELVSLRPGDLLVIKTPYPLRDAERDYLKASLRQYVPDSVGVLVTDRDVELTVYRPVTGDGKDEG